MRILFYRLKKRVREHPRQNQDYSQTSHEKISNYMETELPQFLNKVGIFEIVHVCVQITSTTALAVPNGLLCTLRVGWDNIEVRFSWQV
jgi:hypothetical protein